MKLRRAVICAAAPRSFKLVSGTGNWTGRLVHQFCDDIEFQSPREIENSVAMYYSIMISQLALPNAN